MSFVDVLFHYEGFLYHNSSSLHLIAQPPLYIRKKDAGKRVHPLSEGAVKVIKELFDMYPDSDWLLPSKGNNTPIRLHRFNDTLKRVCEKAGVKYFSSHGIRFHNISALYDAGIEEKEIQRLSRHKTATMTRHYNKSISTTCKDDRIRQVLG